MASIPNVDEKLSIVSAEETPETPDSSVEYADLDAPELYLNRELTWLDFNRRVLHEAQDENNPLLERLKFVGIVSSNLDEFFMKRIGGLKQQVGAGVMDYSVDGRLPAQQIEECYVKVRELEAEKDALVPRLIELLAQQNIHITPYEALDDKDRETIRAFYFENIYPLVTPQGVDSAHPFPFISNLSLNLLVTLRNSDSDEELRARVKVPVGLGIPRFLQVPDSHIFVPLESVMAKNLDVLFPKMVIVDCELFFVTRNANTSRDEEADDLMAMIESEVRHRRFAKIVRVVVQHDMDNSRRGMLAAELGLDEADVFEKRGLLASRDLLSLVDLEIPALRDPPHHPIDHPKLVHMPNIFHAVRDNGSILLHHPYDSFSTSVERLLREASRDPKVRAIKMTLYRTSGDTKVIDYLVDAAQNGKQVAVVVELKARFDEAANIRWSSRLEEAGIHVTYGVMELKTHCKVILVVRNDYSGLRRYVHIGTGNYHAGNARLYTDLGLLTCDPDIGSDTTELFNYLTTGFTPKRDYRKILPAPKLLKRALLDKIQREIEHHVGDSALGHIQIKINALEDKDIVRALYAASQAGVKVDLIVRDTCRLRPGIAGLSDNVRVFSVVGRFLEHSRIYYFQNGSEPEYYIGSADTMMRNLEHRVEVLAPVEGPELQAQLRNIIDTLLSDEYGIWQMQGDGEYLLLAGTSGVGDGSQQALIRDAQDRNRDATRLKRRKAQGIRRRNI